MTLAKGKVLFYDGPFMEPWVENIADSTNPDIVRAPFIDSIPPSVLAQMKTEEPDFPDTYKILISGSHHSLPSIMYPISQTSSSSRPGMLPGTRRMQLHLRRG